ncbi:type III secretion inner membrane ring lipoprotein SctJ [Pseudomonas sp. S75]|uniref:type III secretion system inner membrane ring lipoprotein SctJ n=1 Tax=unclassified Pseudomonas TaxID=196821 RepID=UPI001905DB92|nr:MULTISPECIES: type III secretion inner membrane ring lipoprotein SctJ [unclassified Pseudomonas]MBJ9977899.1 type III secretion inner membrane ring lipoprotein SctJ [Pseudomonas sp. S30]MBK0155895.1 type III secretion inner membrane ring lipoprotein SctJ [Pseudomonas sp. S75]
MFIRTCSTLLLCLLLTACEERSALHSRLSEQAANEVIAALADENIQASKQVDKDGLSVLVARADLNSAVHVLEAAGLPRRSRSSLGDIFRKEGVISTPLEERARYLYALSQELESTLSQIDGVVLARVHVVLPERVAPGEPVQPASASVFIKHTSALDPDSITPRVRSMIASGIPGMADAPSNSSKLSVVFVPTAPYQERRQLAHFGPFLMQADELAYWRTVILVASVLVLSLLLGLGYGIYRLWRKGVLTWPRAVRGTGPGSNTTGAALFAVKTPAGAADDKSSAA